MMRRFYGNVDTVLNGAGSVTSFYKAIPTVQTLTRRTAQSKSRRRMLTMSSQEKKVVPTMKIICSPFAMPVTVVRLHARTDGGADPGWAGDATGDCPRTVARGMGVANLMSFHSVPVGWSNARTPLFDLGGSKS